MKRIYSTLLLCLMAMQALWAQQRTERRVIDVDMDVRTDVDLIIKNQFGKVELIASDKGGIKGTIEIVVSAKNADKINDLLGAINVYEKADRQRVIFNTSVPRHVSTNKGKHAIGDKNFEINYKLYVPSGARITVQNRFGEGVITGFKNFLDLNFEYGGVIVTQSPQADCLVKVNFGRLTVNDVKLLKANAGYSKVEVTGCERADIVAKFGDVTVGAASKSLTISAQYGNVQVYDLDMTLESLSVSNSFGNVDVSLSEKISASVRLSNKFGKTSFKTPDGKFSGDSKGMSSDDSYGFTTGDASQAIPVNLSTSYGNINLRFR